MTGTAAVQVSKEFESELTTSLIEHYQQTGKKYVWASVAKEDGMFPYDFAAQLRRAEMHGEVYIKKIQGDWKVCLTRQAIKKVGEIDRSTIFREICIQEGKEKPRPTRLSRISMRILSMLNRGPKSSADIASGMRISTKDLNARLAMLKKHQYVKKDCVYWKNTSIGEFVIEQERG